MDEEFLSNEILKIYEPYLSLFPKYNKVFKDMINNIIYKENEDSFSLEYKLFYGLMASSTIGCENLLDDFIRIFLNLGGDKSWIEKGLKCENIPEHIREIAKINNILAHKPWIMERIHFEEFKKGLSVFLFQSAIILTTIQRFASIIYGLNLIVHNDKIKEENEDNKVKQIKPEKDEEKIKEENKIKEEKENKDKKDEIKKNKKNKIIEKEIQKVITSVKKNYTEIKEDDSQGEINNLINKKLEKFMSNLIVSHTDFNPHTEKFLFTYEFSWTKDAKFYFRDYAKIEMEYLNKEFMTLEKLSPENIKNDIKINIFNLREAIEKYLTLIFGIKDDKYNYHINNLSMSVELKTIIKNIACNPEQIKEQELESCLEILNKEGLVYLILFVTSIKQKISLTYFAKAFDDYISNNS